MKHVRAVIALSTIAALGPAMMAGPATHAEPDPAKNSKEASVYFLRNALKAMGCEFDLAKEKPSRLSIACYQRKVIDAVPALQSADILNSELTAAWVNTHQVTITSMMTLNVAAMVLQEVYRENPDLNALRVDGAVHAPDDYGNNERKAIFTFGFDRRLSSRINWKNFETAKLIFVAKNFTFTKWYTNSFAAEQ